MMITDRPSVETREFLGGFAVVDVAADQTAQTWAANLAQGRGWSTRSAASSHRLPLGDSFGTTHKGTLTRRAQEAASTVAT